MRSSRDRLTIPVAAVVATGWFAALGDAFYTGKPEVFYATCVPFGTLCGWLFARDIFRRAENGGGDR